MTFCWPGEPVMPRVLLIEDDSETASEIVAELADRGFDVDWASTGIEGLDKARAGKADAMIVDRLLPGIDGLTIIEVVREERFQDGDGRCVFRVYDQRPIPEDQRGWKLEPAKTS